MPFSFQCKDKTWPTANVIASVYPAPDRLKTWAVLGGTDTASMVNVWDATKPLSKVGSPTINAASVTCTPSNCFDSGITLAGDYVFAVVAKIPSGNAMFMGSFKGGVVSPIGDGLGFALTGTFLRNYISTGAVTSNAQQVTTGMDTSKFRVIVGRGTSAGTTLFVWDDTGTKLQVTTAASPHVPNPQSTRIGASRDTATFTGSTQMAFAGIWDGTLTDAECVAIRTTLAANFGSTLGNTL